MDLAGFQALVQRAQDGDRAAMDEVLALLRPRLTRMASQFADPLRPAESTADLLQESCLRAWTRIDTFQGGHDDEETFRMFQSWLRQIVKRIGLDARKAQERQRRIPRKQVVSLSPARPDAGEDSAALHEGAGAEQTPSQHAQSREDDDWIRTALDELADEIDTRILQLYVFEGFTLQQVADQIGLSYDQVRDRYWATVRLLQERKHAGR